MFHFILNVLKEDGSLSSATLVHKHDVKNAQKATVYRSMIILLSKKCTFIFLCTHCISYKNLQKKLCKDIDECLMQYQGLLKVLGSILYISFPYQYILGFFLWKMKLQLLSTFSRMDVVLHFISNIFIMLAIHLPFIYLPDMMAQKGNISSKESR